MVVEAAGRDEPASQDDCVEIFVRSDRNPGYWAQFVVNPAGVFFDQLFDERAKNGGPRSAHDFDCEWAAQIHPVWS